jgi:hypothetical protein
VLGVPGWRSSWADGGLAVVSSRLLTRTDMLYMPTADAASWGRTLAIKNEACRSHIARVGGPCAVERFEASRGRRRDYGVR